MSRLSTYISNQFKNPRGLIGWIVSRIQNVVNNKLYKSLVEMLAVGADDKVLDIGYGNGHLLELIYKKQPADLYGIDISEDAQSMAIARNKSAAQAGQLHLCVGDCCNLPYADDTFNIITTINTVYFWSDTLKGLQEIRRTLVPGQSFYNVMFTKEYLDKIKFTSVGYKKFTPEELADYGESAGFSKVEVRHIEEGKSFVVVFTK